MEKLVGFLVGLVTIIAEKINLLYSFIYEHLPIDGFIGKAVTIIIMIAIFSVVLEEIKELFKKLFKKDAAEIQRKAALSYESDVAEMLEKITRVPTIQNVLIYKNDGTANECDIVQVSSKGIFVYEVKDYYTNWITWTGVYDANANNMMMVGNTLLMQEVEDPFKQNAMHIERISKALGVDKNKIYSVVISKPLADVLTLDNIKVGSNDFVNLINTTGQAYVRYKSPQNASVEDKVRESVGIESFAQFYKTMPDILSKGEVEQYRKILKNHKGSKKELKAHAKRLENRQQA